ncbi:hypothetical protein BGW38_006880, partial [Lunasporangiospora selenospora]
RWKKLFRDMGHYVDDIVRCSVSDVVLMDDGEDFEEIGSTNQDQEMKDADDRDEEEDQDLDVPVSVDFKIDNNSNIVIRHRGAEELKVEYYAIDAETMFSASPLTFSDQGESETNTASSGSTNESGGRNRDDKSSTSFRLILPNGVDVHRVVPIAGSTAVTRKRPQESVLEVPVLTKYRKTNVMISVSTVPPAATKTWRAYYSQTIAVQCLERTGTIRVVTKAQGQPIRGGYVKVYAEMKQGDKVTTFWKDGYTDLVGRFDYAQVSTAVKAGGSNNSNGSKFAEVKRFVVFIDGGKEGCIVKTVPVPPV